TSCYAISARGPGSWSPAWLSSCASSAGSPRGDDVVVIRFLFALLLEAILGSAAVVYLIHSGAGDLLIRRTEAVEDLQRRLRDVELERDRLAPPLDDVVARAGRLESAFADLQHPFRDLPRALEAARNEPARPGS